MARNAHLPRPRRRARTERAIAAAPVASDVATVYSWLCRFTDNPAECERLLVEVLRRSRDAAPDCLRSASDTTRLQFLTIQSVLRLRGVL
jgi:hypothetical protein